jgi:PAS domain S-box-containing protein
MEMTSTGSLATSLAAHFTQQRADLDLYKDLLAMCPIGMFHADADGTVDYVNPAYCRMLDTTLERVINDGWRNILHADDVERVYAWWRTVVDQRIHHASGTARFMVQGVPLDYYYEVVRLASSNNGYAGIVIAAGMRDSMEKQAEANGGR